MKSNNPIQKGVWDTDLTGENPDNKNPYQPKDREEQSQEDLKGNPEEFDPFPEEDMDSEVANYY